MSAAYNTVNGINVFSTSQLFMEKKSQYFLDEKKKCYVLTLSREEYK